MLHFLLQNGLFYLFKLRVDGTGEVAGNEQVDPVGMRVAIKYFVIIFWLNSSDFKYKNTLVSWPKGGRGGPGTGPLLVLYYKIQILFVSLFVCL